jgi:EAL domain-containing protein (putative c-di-GMP-specific phosphodiesterase class I)/GGDEF domain-containing protein
MAADSPAQGRERRAQKRFEVLQAASLKTGSGQEIACEIRNFCLGGLFLRLDGPAVMPQMRAGEDIEVSFTPSAAYTSQTFNVKARLARQGPEGIGVAFVGTPLDATRALNRIATAMRTQRMLGRRYQGTDSRQLQETCRTLLAQAVELGLQGFFGSIEDRLAAAASKTDSFAERNALLSASDQVRVHAALVRDGLPKRVIEAFNRLQRPQPPAPPRDRKGLSIVQTEEFEDWLNISGEISKLEDRFSGDLGGLVPRVEKLYGYPIDRDNNPFGPAAILHAARSEFAALDLPRGALKPFYGALREALLQPLEELYRQLGELLPEATTGARPAPTADAWPDTQMMAEDLNPDAVLFEGGEPVEAPQEQAAALQSEMAAPTVGGIAGALMSLFRRAQQANAGKATGGTGVATVSPVAAPAPVDAGARPAVSVPTVAPAADTVALPMGSISQRIATQSQRVLGELVGSGRIAPAQATTAQGSADVFGVLAETIENDRSLPGSVKQTLRQLEDPLLRLAMLDAGYLNSSKHAAHRVVNVVDRIALASSDDGRIGDQKLQQVVQRWTERIRNEADRNPGIYDEARSQLEKMLQPLLRMRNTRIARLQAGLEGWQKMGQANRAISEGIQRRIEGRRVPDVVLEFFNPGWRNYLIRVMLRHGTGSAAEAEAWNAVDRLLEWMDPERHAQPSFSEAQQLLAFIDARLSLVIAGKDAQERILERLADALFTPDEHSIRMLAGVKVVSTKQEADAPVGERDAALINQFRVGDWLSFSRAPLPMNLIWIGDDPPLYVFSNYRGVRKLELKQQEFLELLKSGDATRTDNLDLPLMDRSFSSMIEHMHRNLVKQATNDAETGLMRTPEFMRRVKRAWLNISGETAGCVMGVVDIEDLRMAQARLSSAGYAGLLQALARHLSQKCCEGGLLARTAERTFAFLRPCDNEAYAAELAERFITRINQFGFEWEGESFSLTANAGLAWSSAYVEPETLYNKADTACLTAKHEGRNQVVFYREDSDGKHGHAGLAYWAGRFNSILSGGRLHLRAQPIVSLADDSRQPAHYEILLGANESSEEPIAIGDFVAAVERLKRVSELDQWVVREIFGWIRNHPQAFEKIGAFSINLSGQSVNSKTFLGFMEEELGRGDIPCDKLIFEITESAAIDSFANAEQFIKKFRRYGCRFSLDDFGVGFSSFTYLKNLKVDYLKIDGSFVRDMQRNEVDVALVSSMHETSRFLGIQTVAESVENEETLMQLKSIGVNYVQGWHTGKPMHIDQLVR